MDQVRRSQLLQSECFLNPFQNPRAQSFHLMPRGCFLKKESAFSALLVSDFKPCPSIGDSKWVDDAALFLLVFPQGLVIQVPSQSTTYVGPG